MRVIAVVQARMNSSRLPGKVMMSLDGAPMIERLLSRLRLARRVHSTLLATSTDPSDDPLALHVERLGVPIVRGPLEDVLARFVTALEQSRADVIVRITGDCPIVDPELVDEVVSSLQARGVDYASNIDPPTFPDGLDVEAFTASALRRCTDLALSDAEREHVTLRMRSAPFQRWNVFHATDLSHRRWTVDERQDFDVVQAVFRHFAPRRDFRWVEVLQWLDSNPAIESVNRRIPRNEGMHMTDEAKSNRAQRRLGANESGSDPHRWRERLLRVIPGGAHTYSRGFDQFPANAPEILQDGVGVYVRDPDGRRFLDFGMGLASVGIGYGEPSIVEAAARGMRAGNGLTRPSMIELEAAELFVSKVRSAEMVKFTKNGSTAVTAAVKLARAHTGRDLILRCAQHPFFSYDDWFIGSTTVARGVPEKVREDTLLFDFNDAAGLERILETHRGQVAAVVLEPATAVCPAPVDGGLLAGCCSAAPCSAGICGGRNFLHQVQDLCRNHGALLILDEMITGFRWHVGGAQALLDVEPDLSTFGKAMANGFSVACVAGRREVMEHGSIEFEGRERVFLLSTTHGAEMCGLAAFVETVNFMERLDVCGHIWKTGARFIQLFNEASRRSGTWPHVRAGGPACKPVLTITDAEGRPSQPLRTLFLQQMVAQGVLMPQVTIAYRHGPDELETMRQALLDALPLVARGIEEGAEPLLAGPAIKPVFRRFN